MKLNLNFKKQGKRFFFFLGMGAVAFVLTLSDAITSSSSDAHQRSSQVNYRTFFGSCPSRAAGTLTMELVRTFEKESSLRKLKEKIVSERLDEKHFISKYEVEYNPYKGLLFFRFDCPEPLMKVQVYKNSGLESYEAILVEGGQLYDPTYEVLLRAEDKLVSDLPYLAIPVGDFDSELQDEIARLVMQMEPKFRKSLAEVILNESNELTMILSVNGMPSSVFMGEELWHQKVDKLQRIIGFMDEQEKIPAIINLTNSKKVVVKFNDRP